LMTAVVRREVFDRVGLFGRTYRVAGDYDFWMRVSSRYPIGYLDEVLCRVRRHGDSLTFKSLPQARAQARIIRNALRANPGLRRTVGDSRIREKTARVYDDLGREWILSGRGRRGRACLKKAWRIRPHPFGTNIVPYYLLSYFPFPRAAEALRRLWHRLRRLWRGTPCL
ncbi:MAG: hypothetical protein HYT89_01800, partial [Candidatus Omnitrophica bacterium]|nr:hypothetical protein [Candidatus Omnitrophota bacterium]